MAWYSQVEIVPVSYSRGKRHVLGNHWRWQQMCVLFRFFRCSSSRGSNTGASIGSKVMPGCTQFICHFHPSIFLSVHFCRRGMYNTWSYVPVKANPSSEVRQASGSSTALVRNCFPTIHRQSKHRNCYNNGFFAYFFKMLPEFFSLAKRVTASVRKWVVLFASIR